MKKIITLLLCSIILFGCSNKTTEETAAPTIDPTNKEVTVKVGEEVDYQSLFTAKDSEGNELEIQLVDSGISTEEAGTTTYTVYAKDANNKDVRATLVVTVTE